jgi:flagellar protein FliS
MNGYNPYAQYRQTSIETATPTRLVVMLYDGALRFLNQALPALQRRDLEAQSRFIGKAQAILAHLRGTLDFKAGGDVARTLERFYINAYDSLTLANIHDDAQKLQTVINGLHEIREAWIEVDRQCQSRKAKPELIAA